ncbi:MAG TPA: head GIN domain-containing protein [Flavobacteriaceae bacterium]|nr:head GIN domain-containing protein [Flavobacteriaceae bacterium]
MRITTQFINFFLLITLIACNNSSGIFSSSTVKGSGNVITESRDASQDFSKVAAKGSVNLFLKKGDFQKIEVEAEDNIMPLVVVEINKGVLTARTEGSMRTKKGVNIYVTYKELNAITSSGSTDVKVESTIESKKVSLVSSGSSDLTVNAIEAKSLEVKSSGSSDIKITNANSKNLALNLSGASDIKIAGKTKSLKANASGSSDLNANNLVATSADLKSSGSSNIKVQVQDKIEVQASGASDIQYIGSPRIVSEKRSGSASIKKR